MRPIRIKIPHTLYDPTPEGEEHTICLFCRSSDKEIIETELEKNPIAGLTKVLALDEIKKTYKQFQSRKKLFKEHTHFLCDDRIFSHVINLLGKVFTSRNNHPIPVDVSNVRKLEASVNKAVNESTYMHPSGSLLTIRFGMTNMSSKKILENIVEGLKVVFEKLQFGLGSLNSIHLKSTDSPALPIHYSHQNEISEFLKNKVVSKKEDKKAKKPKKGEVGPSVAIEEIDAPPVAATVTAGTKKNKKSKSAPVIETIKPFVSVPVSAPPSPAASSSPAPPAGGKKTKKKGPTSAPAAAPSPSRPTVVTPAPVTPSAEKKGANKKNKKDVTPEVAPSALAVAAPVASPAAVVGKKRSKASVTAETPSPVPASPVSAPPSADKKVPIKKEKKAAPPASPLPPAPVTGKKRSKGVVADETPVEAPPVAPVSAADQSKPKKSKLRK
jgi:hypothetical protein